MDKGWRSSVKMDGVRSKWTVLGQTIGQGRSGQSMVQLDVVSFRNWTVTYQTGQFKRLKLDRLRVRKWTDTDQDGR